MIARDTSASRKQDFCDARIKPKPLTYAAEPFALSSEPAPAKRQWLIPEAVELLIEHPFADRK
jgi:hypothetical protein